MKKDVIKDCYFYDHSLTYSSFFCYIRSYSFINSIQKKTTSKSNFITIWKKNDFKIYLQKIIGFYVTSTFSMSTLKLTFTTFAPIYILIIGLYGVWFPELSQANSIFFNFITWRCKWLKICLVHYQENIHQLCCCDFQYYHI